MIFRATFAVPLNERTLGHLLCALVAIDCDYLRANPDCPDLHYSGVRYSRESGETWQSIPQILASGKGDCEDLACWRAAELIVRKGIDARPEAVRQSVSGKTWHIIVNLPVAGYTEDPSRALGMP